jgi:hypothetical protein
MNINETLAAYYSKTPEKALARITYEIASFISTQFNVWLIERLTEDQRDDLFNAMAVFAKFGNHKASQEMVTIGFGRPGAFEQLSFQVVPCSQGDELPVSEVPFNLDDLNWALNVVDDIAPSDSFLDRSFRRTIGNHVMHLRNLTACQMRS